MSKIWAAVQFFFLYQTVWCPFIFIQGSDINALSTLLSKAITVLVVLQWMLAVNNKKTAPQLVLYTIMIYISLGISTFIMDGDIRRWISISYYPIGIAALFSVYAQSPAKCRCFILSVGWMFWTLCFLNFVLVILAPVGIMMPGILNAQYILGGENLVGIHLMVGLAFVLCAYRMNAFKKKYVISYFIMQGSSVLIIFSGGNVTGTTIGFIVLLIPIVKQFFNKFSLASITGIIVGVFILLFIFGQLAVVLDDENVQYLITQVLGKNLTLTHRTTIWDEVVIELSASPVWGYGIRDTYNLFKVDNYMFSAHNQLMQSLYEGGYMILAVASPLVIYSSKKLKSAAKYSLICKASLLGVFIMMMSEAAGLVHLITLYSLSASLGSVRHYSHKNSLQLGSYYLH